MWMSVLSLEKKMYTESIESVEWLVWHLYAANVCGTQNLQNVEKFIIWVILRSYILIVANKILTHFVDGITHII